MVRIERSTLVRLSVLYEAKSSVALKYMITLSPLLTRIMYKLSKRKQVVMRVLDRKLHHVFNR